MYTRKNTRNKTNFVGHNSSGIEIYLSTPLPKAKKASRLTLRAGNARVDLTGRQINALREVLAVGYSTASSTSVSRTKTASSARTSRA